MKRRSTIVVVAIFLGGCSGKSSTDAALAGRAQEAVDHQLGEQATFSETETVVAKQISCGHAKSSKGERDFVYRDGHLIMDDDPDFDQAAVDCDTAAVGGNASVEVDGSG